MIRVTYLVCLFLGLIVLVGMILTIAGLLGPVDESSGNAGAFVAFLSLGVGLIGFGLLAVLGLVGASVGYVFEDKLPSGLLYKYWWPALLALPGVLLIFLMAGKGVVNGF